MRRYYRIRELRGLSFTAVEGQIFAVAGYEHRGSHVHLIATHTGYERLAWSLEAVRRLAGEAPEGSEIVADLYFWRPGPPAAEDAVAGEIASLLENAPLPAGLRRVAAVLSGPEASQSFTFRRDLAETMPKATPCARSGSTAASTPCWPCGCELWRLRNFHLERLAAAEGVYLFRGARTRQPARRAPLRARRGARPDAGARRRRPRRRICPQLERMLDEALAGMRRFQARRAAGERLQWNRVLLTSGRRSSCAPDELHGSDRSGWRPPPQGLGLEKVAVRCRDAATATAASCATGARFFTTMRRGRVAALPTSPPRPAAGAAARVRRRRSSQLRRRGLTYPVRDRQDARARAQRAAPATCRPASSSSTTSTPQGRLVPVDRPHGEQHGQRRGGRRPQLHRALSGGHAARDPARRPQPRHGLARRARVPAHHRRARPRRASWACPLEWFALSAGAKISMDSGTENMDWIARVLRRIVEFTQAGGEINVVVAGHQRRRPALLERRGDHADAHPRHPGHDARGRRWCSPASRRSTTPAASRPRTTRASAATSASWAPTARRSTGRRDLAERLPHPAAPLRARLRGPGRALPAPRRDHATRATATSATSPHGARRGLRAPSATSSPTRRTPAARSRSTSAGDGGRRRPGPPAARALVRHARRRDRRGLGRAPRRPPGLPARHRVAARCRGSASSPPTGPTTGRPARSSRSSSKKVARAINAASGNRPLVVLANLSGFDGSPESMRQLQLEYGAEIGRAVVNFRGPIVFCVVSRYHGGAFVVFSKRPPRRHGGGGARGRPRLGDRRRAGRGGGLRPRGGPRTRKDPRVVELEKAIAGRRAARTRRACAPSSRDAGRRALREAGRGGRGVRPRPQRRARPAGGLPRSDHRAGSGCGRTWSRPSSAGWRRSSPASARTPEGLCKHRVHNLPLPRTPESCGEAVDVAVKSLDSPQLLVRIPRPRARPDRRPSAPCSPER